MRIHLLDVGRTRYGDCILVVHQEKTILIDGAHAGDARSIRAQLGELLGTRPPFRIDLLVVTHCHSDHIGCLPALVERDLEVGCALVADEQLGFGRSADGSNSVDSKSLTPRQRAVLAALSEEDHSGLSDVELDDFLDDAATLEATYRSMLAQLEHRGKVVRYRGERTADVVAIEAQFAEMGLRVLGPSADHLALCAEAIDRADDAFADVIPREFAADATPFTPAGAYRTLLQAAFAQDAAGADRPGVGAAKNNQSLVLRVAADGWSALLAGDMQFAAAEVSGLDQEMGRLRQVVRESGPYDFIKLSHHTSYNGLNSALLDEWRPTRLFAHTGGDNDSGHPAHRVLQLLQANQARLTFARTDRNGIITVQKNGTVGMSVSHGALNDFSPNTWPADPPVRTTGSEVTAAAAVPVAPPETAPAPPAPSGSVREPVESRPVASEQGRAGGAEQVRAADQVEVLTRVPHTATRVTITIQVEPGAPTPPPVVPAHPPPLPTVLPVPVADSDPLRLAGGRELPSLLFVTQAHGLAANIGTQEAERVLRSLASHPHAELLDLPASARTAEEAASAVRIRLAGGNHRGVVLLGGFDIVPPHNLDVLDETLRQEVIAAQVEGADADRFIVWSDEIYGDSDGDFLPELPVTRIPDGRRADVVFAALSAPRFNPGARFGIRNVARPFAEQVYSALPGSGADLRISETFSPEDVQSGDGTGAVYYMLHGSARDGARFWGETEGGSPHEAIAVENVPVTSPGSIVLTGCCWGALCMGPPAARMKPGAPFRPRGPEASVALAYLRAGALGFVGCTGSHYSPTVSPFGYFGQPMHDAFWAAVGRGTAPAEALFQAKREYLKGMPHGQADPFSRAVEMKILRQFTCLGLGW